MNGLLEGETWDLHAALRGRVWRARDTIGSLLLQHGYAEHSGRFVEHYHHLIPHLVAVGFNVYAFDMRGHGGSVGRRAVLDVRQAVQDHIAARHAIGGPVFLFGHSLGGLVTAASVTREQRAVAGVILSSPALPFGDSWVNRAVVRVLSTIAPGAGVATPQSPAGLSRIPDEVEAFERDPLIYHGRMPAQLASTALAVARTTWKGASEWSVPTLILHGTADTFTDVRGSERFVAAIHSDDRRLELMQDGRHELLNDLDRDKVLQTILEWLGTRASAPRTTNRCT